ncbi:MAG: SDR family oxidoreductase [Thermoleophilaceae bacterium]|nr:SDR family oxidoreductase [Thermoleophilaceae bacterium]
MSFPKARTEALCVVTGASSGIGAETARRMAGDGYNLMLVDRDAEALETIAAELRERNSIEVRTLAADLRNPDSRASVLTRAHEGGKQIDVLVNCAGLGAAGNFVDDPVERALEMIDINVAALVDLTWLVMPEMVERDSGAILNVASGAGFQPMPRFAAYAASKAFVLTFSESLSAELMGTGVTVTTLCPGPTHSKFTEVAGLTDAEGSTPGIFWKTSSEVADYGVNAMRRGRRVAIPSKIFRVTSVVGGKGPRAVTLAALDRFWPAEDKA